MQVAHDLHQEVRQRSSKANDIIAAAMKVALFTAKLSQLLQVWNKEASNMIISPPYQENSCSKRDLISIAKAIAESSDEVTRLAMDLAKECTDKRMRTVSFLIFINLFNQDYYSESTAVL